MNSKTAKLIRKVARTNPYGNKNEDENNTLYGKHKVHGNTVLAPGFRATCKWLTKFHKEGRITTADLNAELRSVELQKIKEKMAEVSSEAPVSS